MASGGEGSDAKGQRLDSWKSIARYVGRDVRSAQRWERERGLPVHRVPGEKGGSVFAYAAELDDWLHGRVDASQRDQIEPSDVTPEPESTSASAPSSTVDAVQQADAAASVPADLPVETAALAAPRRNLLIWFTLATLLVLGVLAAIYLKLRPAATPSKSSGGRIMLAVLPFSNLSGDPSQDYFADGLTEEMITDLGRINPQALGVIARTSAMRYKDTREDLGQIGRELGVGYVVEGSVRREGNTVRISAQLIQVRDRTHVWAQNYQRQVKDILSVQRDVAQSIASKIRVNLERQPGNGVGAYQAANPEAYDDYLKGLYFWNRRDVRSLQESFKYFNQSIQEDPNYAPAYAALAEAYILQGLADAPFYAPDVPKAAAAARKAIALDDSAPEGHTALAGLRVFYYYDWPGAEAEFKRALELNPNYAPAHHWYANLYLDPQGRYQEAIAELKLAQQLDPTNLIVNADLGLAYYFARQYPDAIDICKKTSEMDPSFLPPLWYLADAYHQMGMTAEEVSTYAHFTSLEEATLPTEGSDRDWGQVLTDAYRKQGYQAFLRTMLDEFQAAHRVERNPPERLATTYLLLGEKDKAMDALERGYQQHAPNIIYLKADPYYDALRSEPRFQSLERKLGLPVP